MCRQRIAQQGRRNDLIASAAIPEADRRGAIAGEILQHASCGFLLPRRAASSPGRWRSLANAQDRRLVTQRRHDVLGLVGQHGGRFRQPAWGKKKFDRPISRQKNRATSAMVRQPKAAPIAFHRPCPPRPPCWAKASRPPPSPRPTGPHRQRRRHRIGRFGPPLRISLQALQDHPFQGSIDFGHDRGAAERPSSSWARRSPPCLRKAFPGNRFVEHDAEGIQIAADRRCPPANNSGAMKAGVPAKGIALPPGKSGRQCRSRRSAPVLCRRS